MIAALITTYNRPAALTRSAWQIARLGVPTLVVDDGSDAEKAAENKSICDSNGLLYMKLPGNRGLAAALNTGLSYWLADSRIRWISYFQDDVDVHARALEVLGKLQGLSPLLTGHDAGEHEAQKEGVLTDIPFKIKRSCRATHMHGSADFWRGILPIPTNDLGTPRRNGQGKGIGSNVDWWIVRDAPNSIQKNGGAIVCVPGLVRSFLWMGKDSCWNNTAKCGEEPPLTELWKS
jgi:hypothetical protein